MDTGGKGVCESYPTIGLPQMKRRDLYDLLLISLIFHLLIQLKFYPVTHSEVFTTSMMLN